MRKNTIESITIDEIMSMAGTSLEQLARASQEQTSFMIMAHIGRSGIVDDVTVCWNLCDGNYGASGWQCLYASGNSDIGHHCDGCHTGASDWVSENDKPDRIQRDIEQRISEIN